jgi:soluble lytic murein transglycosylase
VAIATAAKANAWDDIDLRFPLLYSQTLLQQGQQQQVDPAWLYGLTRQESAFDAHAESSAGAKGLMQLLPETAKTVARHNAISSNGGLNLFQPELNIALGSAYFNSLLKQFNGQYLVATAAYNAGPHRVRQWLPQQALPADIWAETIPFKETRGYVAAVFLYALIYQQRLQRGSLQPGQLLHTVRAG